ncbi:MAG: peptidase T [Hallerella sp.]|jgi:tripeptide aminopeptidase|nr:peptidase T [Fibrobacter sp.]MDY6368729.1 peptidase T [Fibrobacter sp.]MDY6389219.1 peptidase T [Fibrobacter sp.]MEE3339244.1 peptidase T [Hallerella sp.]
MKILDRFLQYVRFTTTSDEKASTCPSTAGQLELGNYLAQELKNIGLSQVKIDEHGYVYGMLPATFGHETDDAIGFISHMDTSPDFSGVNPKPQVFENYNGSDVVLQGSGDVLRTSEFLDLETLKGRTLVTTDGTTLLGADDKAGMTAIVTAMERLAESDRNGAQIPHGDIWVGFTPDEEIGRGADLFDLNYFKAKYAYTVDGSYEGELAYENFNAATAIFKVRGKSVHPGEAKGIMKNASLIAAEIAMALPKNETPATTEGREGFYHLIDMQGDVSEAKLVYIVRDHDQQIFEKRLKTLEKLAVIFNSKYGGVQTDPVISVEIKNSYSNMLQVIERYPQVLERARSAIRKAGIEPVSKPVRGGTDGARLSFMGLPCPNLGTGGYAYHGPFEHVTVEGIETVSRIILNIAMAQ